MSSSPVRPLPETPKSQNVAVFGATGSIGTATIDVLGNLKKNDSGCEWHLHTVSGHRNLAVLEKIAANSALPPRQVVISDVAAKDHSVPRWSAANLQFGPEALVAAAADPEVDTVVAAIVGRAGLESTLAAIQAGKRVALANKETMVVAGPLVGRQLSQTGACLLPVDSEHSAIFQCLGNEQREAKKLILTASGGPFRTWSADQMQQATPADALAHPTWEMGRKITIDSATMMNKALEIIEARWLFDWPADQIEVVVHPQSIVHSLVEFSDGSVISQLSPPDMRLPIQYALTWPRRLPCDAPPLDRETRWNLEFEPADRERFPALNLGFEVARVGGTAGVVVNAANERAVGLFLSGEIRFTDIVVACQTVLQNHHHEADPTLTRLLELDQWARDEVTKWTKKSG